jgi:hypothetical protein
VPNAGQRVEIDGRMSQLQGSCPTVRFVVRGEQVRTTPATDFRKMDCGDLRNGWNVDVRGVVENDGTILATRIDRD